MRHGSKQPTDSDYYNIEVAVNELVRGAYSSSADVDNLASSASSQTMRDANTDRKGLIIFNDSTAILYVKFGATASTTDFTFRLTPQGVYEMRAPIYTGRIDIIHASENGTVRNTELT